MLLFGFKNPIFFLLLFDIVLVNFFIFVENYPKDKKL